MSARGAPAHGRSRPPARPAEETRVHTRLLKCALEVEDARAYWQRAGASARATAADGSAAATAVSPRHAFERYWFGAKSLARVEILLTNFRARFDAFPPALEVLEGWRDMAPDTRRAICHWHLQLSDPLYRAFTGDYLVERRDDDRGTVTRPLVVAWVGTRGADRWSQTTQVQFASKLLSAAHAAGLVAATRDPRPLALPRIPGEALAYLLYLLRGVAIDGTLLANPYLASVGLTGAALERRLRDLPGLTARRQADLIDLGWHDASLRAWAEARGIHAQGQAQAPPPAQAPTPTTPRSERPAATAAPSTCAARS